MYEDETFVCGRCPLVQMKKPVRQLAYEYVATRMMFKCSNKKLGCCTEELFPCDLMLHEASCTFRKIECTTWCSWTGSVNNIKNHFKQKHPKLLFNKMAEITTKEVSPEMILIESSNKLFKLTSTMTENKLTLSIAFIGAAEEGFQCTVLETNKRALIGIITIQPDVQRFDPNLSYTLLNKEVAEKIVVCVDKVEQTREEITHNPELEQSYDNILSALKCTVCSKSMVPPIIVMPEGNSTCEGCIQKPANINYPNVHGGVFGRDNYTEKPSSNIRNFNLEKLTESVRYYCRYKDCGKRLIGHLEKVKHEKMCSFTPLNCTFCNYSAALEEFIDHLKQHSEHVATNDIKLLLNNDNLITLSSTIGNSGKTVSAEPTIYMAPNNVNLLTNNGNQCESNQFCRTHIISHRLRWQRQRQSTTSSTSNCYMIRSQCVFEFEYTKIMNMHRFALYLRGSKSSNDKFDFIMSLKSIHRNNNMNMKFRMPCAISEPGYLMLPDSLIESFIDDSSLPVHVDIIDKSCQMFALV